MGVLYMQARTLLAMAGLAGMTLAAIPAARAQDAVPAMPQDCELHVWPTENYIGINTGLLSGFGLVGAVADVAAHDGRVATFNDLMREYLGPDVQVEELNKIGIAKSLKLDNYRVVIEPPTPFNEDVKKDPALKAAVKVMNAKIKNGERLTDSKAACYAELVGTMIFYHKAMMYGSNLFGGWIFREFPATGKATRQAMGAVKNPLENFPPKTPDMVDAAKLELRDAYSKDFSEYLEKKVFGAPAAK